MSESREGSSRPPLPPGIQESHALLPSHDQRDLLTPTVPLYEAIDGLEGARAGIKADADSRAELQAYWRQLLVHDPVLCFMTLKADGALFWLRIVPPVGEVVARPYGDYWDALYAAAGMRQGEDTIGLYTASPDRKLNAGRYLLHTTAIHIQTLQQAGMAAENGTRLNRAIALAQFCKQAVGETAAARSQLFIHFDDGFASNPNDPSATFYKGMLADFTGAPSMSGL